jgi:SAM dependent carboxyl methyltransferase
MRADALEVGKATEGMVDYDRNSAAQQRIVRLNAGRIRSLIERLGYVRPDLKIVDYGCGPGTSAIDAVAPAIEAYRALFPEGPISICHADQSGNDWNALFELAAGPSGYLYGTKAIRSGAAVGSFYDQMVAEGSVALGTSFVASHWLHNAVRLHSPGTVWFADLRGKARADMAAIAQRDWTRFLRCRALELRPNGFLLVSTLGAVSDDSEINGAAASGRGIYRALQHVAQEMAGDGLINRDILDSFVFGLWFMTESEARAPLKSDLILAKAFEIEDIRVEPAPANQSDIFAESIGNPAEYARLYVGYTRAFGASTLRTQLFEPCSHSAADADRLAEEFYRRLEKLYQTSAGRYACEIWNLTVVLRRTLYSDR